MKHPNEKIQAIGDALGWEYVPHKDGHHVVHFRTPEGRRVIIYEVTYPASQAGRIGISGYWPYSKGNEFMATTYDGESNPSITVSGTKTGEEIGKHIVGRFLPDFVNRWDQVAERVRLRNEHADNTTNLRQKVCDLIDGASMSQLSKKKEYGPHPHTETSR